MRRTVLTGLVIALTSLAAAAEPAFFSDKPYQQARSQAAEEDKLFFVKATAVWCGPCKMMDRTTFKDGRVIEWLSGKAVSVSVDVDDEPALAKELGIRAMPTAVLFRGDDELARVVGYKDADSLLAWLVEASSGAVQRAKDQPVPENTMARRKRAKTMLIEGDLDEATTEYVWLWENMLTKDPSMSGVRGSFMATEMQSLAAQHAPARKAFEMLRDASEKRLRSSGNKSWSDLDDWLVLNERVLNDREPIRAWIDRIASRESGHQTLARSLSVIDSLLIDDGRWTLYGSLIENPSRVIRIYEMSRQHAAQVSTNLDEDTRAMMLEASRANLRKKVSLTVAALLAADRDEEARQLAQEAIETLDTPRMRKAIVTKAREIGQLRDWHIDLLDHDELRDLRREIETEL